MVRKTLLTVSFGIALSCTSIAYSATYKGETLAEKQEFTYRLLDDVKSFDPQINSTVDGSHIIRNVFEGLMNEGSTGELAHGAASSYAVSEDKLTYTFTLREANWSNGEAVSAGDFVYAWRRLVDPATASEYAWYMELMGVRNASAIVKGDMPIDQLGVRAVDDKTFEVVIENALPYFVSMTVHGSTFPTLQSVVEKHGSNWTKPGNMIGNGAYTLSEYRPGEKIVLDRDPTYWNDANTTINRITALVINDENQALTRYLAGETDRTEIPAGQYPRLSKELPDEALSYPRSCSYIYWFNQSETGPEALKDVRVRKALSYAINREVVTDRILQGGQYQSYNFTHQKTAGFTLPDISYASWTQQQRDAKAKELMAEAGYGAGGKPLKVTISYNTSEAHKKIAIAVSQFWKKTLGVEVELLNTEWKVHTDNLQNGNYEIARYAWCGDYNEASTYLDLLTSYSGHNVSGYADAAYDKLMADSKTQLDPGQSYSKAEAMLADAMPFAPIYQYTGNIMLKPTVRGWPVDNLMQNWYGRELYMVEQ